MLRIPSNDAVFEEEQLSQFKESGFVKLERAFPPEVAGLCREHLWNILERERGIKKHKITTWTEERVGLTKVFTERDGSPWSGVFTERLYEGVSQLLGGSDKWRKGSFGCGWWVISFPKKLNGPWSPCGNWHIDGSHFHHFVHSKEQALLPVMLFSDVEAECGGTALAVGSHIHTANILYSQPAGLKGGELSRIVRSIPGITSNIVEITGKAGDVIFLHPFLLHARSKNLSSKGFDGVRFACFPCVPSIFDLRVHERDQNMNPSPVEDAILQARDWKSFPIRFGKRKTRSERQKKEAKQSRKNYSEGNIHSR